MSVLVYANKFLKILNQKSILCKGSKSTLDGIRQDSKKFQHNAQLLPPILVTVIEKSLKGSFFTISARIGKMILYPVGEKMCPRGSKRKR